MGSLPLTESVRYASTSTCAPNSVSIACATRGSTSPAGGSCLVAFDPSESRYIVVSIASSMVFIGMTGTYLHVLQPDLTCLVPRRCNFWPVRNRPSNGGFIADTIVNLLWVYISSRGRSPGQTVSMSHFLREGTQLRPSRGTMKYLYELLVRLADDI